MLRRKDCNMDHNGWRKRWWEMPKAPRPQSSRGCCTLVISFLPTKHLSFHANVALIRLTAFGMRDSSGYEEGRDHRRRDRSRSRSSNNEKRRDRHSGYHSERRRDGARPYRRRSRSRSSSHTREPRVSQRAQQVQDKRSRDRSRSRSPARRAKAPLPSQVDSYRNETGQQPMEAKQKPNFKPTGLLAKEANTIAGTTTVLKYHEPTEARKPPASQQWRMYVFKEKDVLVDTVYLFERSCWLFGRDQKITDVFLEHPSISKQHAVVQFRHSSTINEFGDKINRVRPYLIDLESANGTLLNGQKIGVSRYVELVDGDVVAFGSSESEYVMMLPPPDRKQ